MKTTRWDRRALAAAAAACVGLTLALGTGSPAQGEDWLHFPSTKALNGAASAVVVDGTDISTLLEVSQPRGR